MPLYLLGASEANVYNNLGMFVNSVGVADENVLPLFVTTGSGIQIDDDEFSMFVSGVGVPNDQLNLITFGWGPESLMTNDQLNLITFGF